MTEVCLFSTAQNSGCYTLIVERDETIKLNEFRQNLKEEEIMYLTITDAALEKINPILKAEPGRRLVMMYEDGVSPYSHHGEVAMQVSFVLAIIREDQPLLPWFDETIDSNIGPLPIKGYSKDYMIPNMVLDVKKFGGVVLRGDSGVIDDTPEIRDETATVTD